MKRSTRKIELKPARLQDYPIIRNLARFYVYDMNQYMDWKVPENGMWTCISFKRYWKDRTSHPYLIHVDDELAGFVIVNKTGADASTDFNMAQFFVVRKFCGQGIGLRVASECFDRFPGAWSVMALERNLGAYEFWKKTIGRYTRNRYTVALEPVKHFKGTIYHVFRFRSANR